MNYLELVALLAKFVLVVQRIAGVHHSTIVGDIAREITGETLPATTTPAPDAAKKEE